MNSPLSLRNDDTSPRPHVAVIICTYDRPKLLERCLQSLVQLRYDAFSTVVVDNFPSSETVQALSAKYGARYVACNIKGLSRARNLGLLSVSEDILAFIDDDVVALPEWLDALVKEFDDPAVIAVTGPLLCASNMPVRGDELTSLIKSSAPGPFRFQIDLRSPMWFERVNFGYVGDGNFALRRSGLQSDGRFHEHLGRGATLGACEDHYMLFKILISGGKITYTPDAIVLHSWVVPDPERVVAEATAYGAFLVWNHPQYAWRVARYSIGHLPGVVRSPPRSTARSARSGGQTFRGMIKGLWRFLHFAFKNGRGLDRAQRDTVLIGTGTGR